MSVPLKPWEVNRFQNSQFVNNNPMINPISRPPILPPRPTNSPGVSNYAVNSYLPYSGMGYGRDNSYGMSYGSYGMPLRGPLCNSYGSSYGAYNNYGMPGNVGYPNYSDDDHERRFIQYAEESSRNTFANVESIVRAFSSMSMMLDNTFFAMTSSFRAVLSVAENFGRLRTVFGQIWYSVNIFRFFNWLYRKLMKMLGYKVPDSLSSVAWKEAAETVAPPPGKTPGSNWPTIAFLGMLVSAPYIISKFLPKYEDKGDPANWKSPGVQAKAVFDFVATGPNELTIRANDKITIAPTYIQEEMNLKDSGWAFAMCNGRTGVVPLNYLKISSKNTPVASPLQETVPVPRIPSNNMSTNKPVTNPIEKPVPVARIPSTITSTIKPGTSPLEETVPAPKIPSNNTKTHTKRVSFGENQIFENVDSYDFDKSPTSNQAKKENNSAVGAHKEILNSPKELDASKSLGGTKTDNQQLEKGQPTSFGGNNQPKKENNSDVGARKEILNSPKELGASKSLGGTKTDNQQLEKGQPT